MKCPSCQHENKPAAKFCSSCRATLPRACPACATEVDPDDRFCPECGAELQALQAAASAPRGIPALSDRFAELQQALPEALRERLLAPEDGENRVVTIVFADLTGSVRATAQLSPEQAAALVNDVLKTMVDAIMQYDGRINRLLGDAVLAFFGTPQAHENDPERAILAALTLRQRVQAMGLNVTIGINTGEVYLGGIGSERHQEFTAMGSVVNLAARLREAAAPGEIIVGESVYRQTMRQFDHAPRTLRLKGLEEPMTAYVVVRPLPRPEKLRGIEGLRAELIGREEELARISESLKDTLRGRGRMVSIIGEAGVGKSRLVAELKLMALRKAEDATTPLWLEGRCLDVGITVSYWPFLDLLRAWFGWTVDEDERARAERVSKSLTALAQRGCLAAERIDEIGPLLGKLLSIRFGGAWDERLVGAGPEETKQQTFLAVRDLVVALARQAPLVLVLEDLHWADNLSLDLLALMMETLTLAPILLVCVYRPEQGHPCRHLEAIARRKCMDRYTEIALHELSLEQSRRMVDSLLRIDALPPSVKEQVLAKAQGNPFFVEEVIRSLIDSGSIYREADAWRAREDVVAIAVPETLQGVILGRVDRLEAKIRHVLQSAAVIGRLFRRRLVGEVARQVAELDRALGELEDRALIYRDRAVPEEEYSFQHVLTQETVYNNILSRRRAQIHRHVAEAIEALYPEALEEHYEQLAYHFDRGKLADKAIEYYYKSGEKASGLYANQSAVSHFSRGLELLRGSAEVKDAASREMDFLVALGVPLVLSRGHYSAEVEQTYLRARAIGEQVGTPEQVFQVALGLRRLYFIRGEHRRAGELDQDMIALGRRERDPVLTCRAHMMLCESLLAIGDYPGLLEHSQSGQDLYDPKQYRLHVLTFGNDTGVGCQLYRAQAEWLLGFPDRSLETVQSAVQRSREITHPFTLVYALYNAGVVAFMRREPQRAAQLAEECLAIARRERFPLYRGFAPVVLGWARGMTGQEKNGAAMVRGALEELPAGLPFRVMHAAMLAEVYGKGQRIREALEALDEGFAVVRNTDAHLWEPELYRLRGEIGLLAGEADADAERCFQESLQAAQRQQALSLELRAALSFCRLKPIGERAAETRDRVAAVLKGFSEGFGTADLAEARRVLDTC